MGYLKKRMAEMIYLLAFVSSFFIFSTASAQENSINLSLDATGKYSDNIEYVRDNKRDDYYTIISPSIHYSRLSELSDFSMMASVDVLRYQEVSDQNSENQEYSMTGNYSPTERTSLSGNLSFKDDIALQGELIDTGEISAWQHRRQYIGNGGGSWRFAERTAIGLTYQFLKKEFEGNTGVDYDQHLISMSLSRYMNNGIDTISLVPGFNYTETTYGTVDDYNLSLGWLHTFSETFRMNVSLGGRYTEEAYDSGLQFDSFGWIAGVNISRTSEKGAFTIGYSRNLWTNFGGGQSEVDQITLEINKWIFRRLGFGFSGAYYLRNQPDNSADQRQTVFRVSPRLDFRLTEKHILGIGYQYDSINAESIANNGTTEVNTVWVELKLTFDKKY